MTSRDFCYWLQGYFEISGETVMSANAVSIVKNHLNMVFKHEIDPSFGDQDHQKQLSEVHKGIKDHLSAISGSGGTGGSNPGTLINC